MLDEAPEGTSARFPLVADKKIEDVVLEGTWNCTRSEGSAAKGGRAVVLECSVEQGKAVQALARKHGREKAEGVFLGVLKVIRIVSPDKTLQAQELQMKLLLGVEKPNALRLSTEYRSLWCSGTSVCPKTSW